jgi:hypothetical protein
MEEPSQEVIDGLKKQFPSRSLQRVDVTVIEDEDICLIMTGPSEAEYERFTESIQKALEIKAPPDRERAARVAIQNAALAQIRWPARDEMNELFARYPALVNTLAEQLHKSAGASAEVRAKKL